MGRRRASSCGEKWVETARVVEIRDPSAIGRTELEKLEPKRGERLLFKTMNSYAAWDSPKFVEDFVHLADEEAQYLVECERSASITCRSSARDASFSLS